MRRKAVRKKRFSKFITHVALTQSPRQQAERRLTLPDISRVSNNKKAKSRRTNRPQTE
jgi:hypothetical protein